MGRFEDHRDLKKSGKNIQIGKEIRESIKCRIVPQRVVPRLSILPIKAKITGTDGLYEDVTLASEVIGFFLARKTRKKVGLIFTC